MADVAPKQSALAHFVETKWRVSGQRQTEYVQDALGLDSGAFAPQTLSKFIRGRLAAVPKGLIEALARRYDMPIEQLEMMAVTPARAPLPISSDQSGGTGPTLQFVLGHTVWAASFLIAMLSVRSGDQSVFVTVEKARLASRGRRDADGSWTMGWKLPDGQSDSTNGDRDTPERAGAGADSGVAVMGDGASVRRSATLPPFSAPAVAEFLESDEAADTSGKVVTFGMLPWDIAEERQAMPEVDGHYIRLATIMDSAAACCVVLRRDHPDIHLSGQPGNNMVTSGALARHLGDSNGRHIVLAEQGTVAAEQAKKIAELAEDYARRDGRKGVQVVWEHCSTTSLEEQSWKTLSDQHPGLAAIITWDPQATQLDRGSQAVVRYNLVDVHGKHGGPGHTTFDIVLFVPEEFKRSPTAAGWRSSVVHAVKRLYSEILPTVQRRQASLINLARGNREPIELLKSYFEFDKLEPKLSSHEIARIFANLRFSASIDPCGMAEADRITETTKTE